MATDTEIDEYIAFSREWRGALTEETPQFETWFERQSRRLAQLETAATRPLTDEERVGLEQRLIIGPSVHVCEMPLPQDEYLIGFAMATPAANVLWGLHPNVVARMATRMRMRAAKHRDAFLLIDRYGADGRPLALFCAVRRPWRPAQVQLASIALSGALIWFTNIGSSTQQILLVHEAGDVAPRIRESEQLEYLLVYANVGEEGVDV